MPTGTTGSLGFAAVQRLLEELGHVFPAGDQAVGSIEAPDPVWSQVHPLTGVPSSRATAGHYGYEQGPGSLVDRLLAIPAPTISPSPGGGITASGGAFGGAPAVAAASPVVASPPASPSPSPMGTAAPAGAPPATAPGGGGSTAVQDITPPSGAPAATDPGSVASAPPAASGGSPVGPTSAGLTTYFGNIQPLKGGGSRAVQQLLERETERGQTFFTPWTGGQPWGLEAWGGGGEGL